MSISMKKLVLIIGILSVWKTAVCKQIDEYGNNSASSTKAVDSETQTGMNNNLVSIVFDKKTGKLVSLKNLATGDEYIKKPNGDGNPFRAYLDAKELPKPLRFGFPNPVQPPDDALKGMLIQPKDCVLKKSMFVRNQNGGTLQLTLEHPTTSIVFDLKTHLPDDDYAVHLELTAINTGKKTHQLIMAIPYLTGVQLGNDGNTNLAVRLLEFGQSRGEAWKNAGDIYGRQWGGQWNAVYEPSLNEGLGVIVYDKTLQEKILQRHPGGIMSVLYFVNQELPPGKVVQYPKAELLVHKGNWKVTAHRYGEWFRSAFTIRKQPKWVDEVGMFVGPWIPSPDAVAEAKKHSGNSGGFKSFTQLPQLYARDQYDLKEWAQYWQGVIRHKIYHSYNHTDGIYDCREDLGGVMALKEGIARSEKIGRYSGLYFASATVRKDSVFFQSPNPGAGQSPKDWMLMETPNAKEAGVDGGTGYIHMCLRYGPWQDHVAAVCKRLLRETGAKYIRLDEAGSSFGVCHNPAHHHKNPYVATAEMLEFFRVVRAAMDEVDPEALLFTEGGTDLLSISCNGTLGMWAPGIDIAPLRLVASSYIGLSYGQGQVDCALNGYICGGHSACGGGWWNAHHGSIWSPGLERMPKRYAGQPGCPAKGISLRWNELERTFVDATRHGTTTDVNPIGIDQDPEQWAGRLWKSENYWLLVCGDRAAYRPKKPVRVKLPELPDDVKYAIEYDVETLAMREAKLERGKDGIIVTTQAGFSAVLLPRPSCPPLIDVSKLPTLNKGKSQYIKLTAVAPWRSPASKVKVQVSAKGLQTSPQDVELPVKITLTPSTEIDLSRYKMEPPPGSPVPQVCHPPESEVGYYKLEVKGDCLPLKRWIEVK